MYSTTITPKVEKMFSDLRTKSNEVITETNSVSDAVNKITQFVSLETASRSKKILSDMLFDSSDNVLNTPFFQDISRQNKFMEMNLRQEILNKYKFTTNTAVDFKEANRIAQSLKVAGITVTVVGAAEIGMILIQGLTLSSLIAPVPISILVTAALGAALTDYIAVEPNKNKKNFKQAVEKYLEEAQQQFLNWFDEIEKYFNQRVDEIKQTI